MMAAWKAEPAAKADITSILPGDVLQYCFSFVGPGFYCYVAGTSRHFRDVYSREHEKKTKQWTAALSFQCAELCFEEHGVALLTIVKQALLTGQVEVLEWARNKGFEFTKDHFFVAAVRGQTCILKWAGERNLLEWYTTGIIMTAAEWGHLPIFEWCLATRRAIPVQAGLVAAREGQLEVLIYMRERNLLGVHSDLWYHASNCGRIEVLDWLYNNRFQLLDRSYVLSPGVRMDRRNVLEWAREHGISWNESSCADAAFCGNLSLLQWLRENGCPWNVRVMIYAERKGHEHVVDWAIENGCPLE